MSAEEGVLARGKWVGYRWQFQEDTDLRGEYSEAVHEAVVLSLSEYERLKRCEAEVQSVNAEQGVRSDPNYQSEGLAELAERGYQRLKRRKP